MSFQGASAGHNLLWMSLIALNMLLFVMKDEVLKVNLHSFAVIPFFSFSYTEKMVRSPRTFAFLNRQFCFQLMS